MTVSVLFCAPETVYSSFPDTDLWPETRDARGYSGPNRVVAHPPCARWCSLAKLNEKRYGLRVGDDGGCFASALSSVFKHGGILEHPKGSLAWETFELCIPKRGRWIRWDNYWVTEVSQSAYGHRARKATWLLYVGPKPFELDWSNPEGTHQIGWFDRVKPTLSKKEALKTPEPFADLLLSLARLS